VNLDMPLQQPSFLWLIYKEVFQLDTTLCVATKEWGKSALAASKRWLTCHIRSFIVSNWCTIRLL
jgi:hypothetical protein